MKLNFFRIFSPVTIIWFFITSVLQLIITIVTTGTQHGSDIKVFSACLLEQMSFIETNVDLKWQEFMGQWISMMKLFRSTKILVIRP